MYACRSALCEALNYKLELEDLMEARELVNVPDCSMADYVVWSLKTDSMRENKMKTAVVVIEMKYKVRLTPSWAITVKTKKRRIIKLALQWF